jgi:hypothetical protein
MAKPYCDTRVWTSSASALLRGAHETVVRPLSCSVVYSNPMDESTRLWNSVRRESS